MILSGYHILERLYESTTSEVYRARRAGDHRPVILKVLKQIHPPPEKIAWFKREYETTRTLDCAGVVDAYSLENHRGRLVMLLEDFGGESLERLKLAGTLPLNNFLRLALALAEILGQIHQRHIMHKDITPSNIVLNPVAGQLKMIDFGISTTLPRENPTFRNPAVLEGTLAYMSPEQTGRMNRAMDYRTDFYSLGVTFYELLTGQLPFPATHALTLIHAHIASQPLLPHHLNPAVPPVLSEIILKLMAKNAEDRYQSTAGLKADLEECLRQWQATQRIESFPLGRQDIPDRFQIPQKLYGREQEIETLLGAFEQVAGEKGAEDGEGQEKEAQRSPVSLHRSLMLLVTGAAGIGKTALVREVYPSLTRRRGYFIAGKFDQFQRNIPYAALIQAFRILIRQLLTESEAAIAVWRNKLLAALGPNGQVIIEVVPEVERIIGLQPQLPTLAPAERLNRFNLTFQNFIQVFTQHPLVIFLDDLQWADGASLKLIESLISRGRAGQQLFLIGAYRDNEVDETHPLSLAIAAVKQAGTPIPHIHLAPLALTHVTRLLAETLRRPPAFVGSLAGLALSKTGGNPFFLNQFFRALVEEKLLAFIPDGAGGEKGGGWQWDLAQIQRRGITDNVVELMAAEMQQLPLETQAVLKLAACLGNQFGLDTLALVYEQAPEKTALVLWPALLAGLVLPLSDAYKIDLAGFESLSSLVSYKFAHDRIQQAAYSLIPEQERPAVHRQVGRLLLARLSPGTRVYGEHLFDIVDQLNLGRSLLSSQTERDELAELNLRAGQRARASAAYQPALNYLRLGLELLSPLPYLESEGADTDSWQRRYELALNLYGEAAEAALLNGYFDEMEQLAEVVLQQAKTLLDRIKIYELKVQADTMQNKFLAAVKTALYALELLGQKLPEQPGQADIILGLQEIQAMLADLQARSGKQIEALNDLPELTDPEPLAAMHLLSGVTTAVFIAVPELYPLIVFKLVKLSLKYGLAAESAFVCTNYAIILCGFVGDIETGYAFGQLATRLLERFKAEKVKARTLYLLNCFIRHWKEPLRDSVKGLAETYQVGLETGDFEYAGFAALTYPCYAYFAGWELNEVEQEMAKYGQATDQINQKTASRYNDIWRQAVLNLLGQAEDACRLVGESYDEDEQAPQHLQANDRQALFMVRLNKLILCYLLGKIEQAFENAAQAEIYLDSGPSSFHIPVANFYGSLARLAHYSFAAAPEKEIILNKVAANQEKMRQWANHAPMNHLHRYYLVEAERARVLAQIELALDYYQQAIAAAGENGYRQEEALGYELLARFYLVRGLEQVAQTYMLEAYYGYLTWGGRAKTDQLLAVYPQLLAPLMVAPQPEPGLAELQAGLVSPTMTQRHPAERLDLAALLKATQAITAETELTGLLETLLRIVMQNAGAGRGWLLLPKASQSPFSEEWRIEAEITVQPDRATVLQGLPLKPWPATPLPLSLINYVIRTQEAVVLDDPLDQTPFAHDPYLLARRPQSVLCLPLVSQGRLKGLLYLENRVAKGVFTPERLELLKLLAAPATIAIENALLTASQPAAVTPPNLAQLPHSLFIPDTGEELTRRETEILALLAAGATNRAIASQLVISRDTVKTHLKNIFAKLGVTSRDQAAARARELKLL